MNGRQPVCNPERMDVERAFARGIVIAGGVFWVIAAFAAPYAYQKTTFSIAIANAIYPFAATMVTLIIGWVYERLAALLLGVGAAGVAVWGVLFGWEPFVWMIMSTVLIGPMVLAGTLFFLAGRMADVCRISPSPPHGDPVVVPQKARI